MKKSHKTLKGILILGSAFLANLCIAQNLASDSLQPAQGAQMTLETTLPETASTEKTVTASPKKNKTIPQIVIPENATKKQAHKLEKLNQALAKQAEATENGQVKEPTKLQKTAAKIAMRKMEKKLQKAGIENPDQFLEATEDQSSLAAQAMNKLTLIGIILLGAGFLFLFIIAIVGLLFMIGGLVCLIMGVAQS